MKLYRVIHNGDGYGDETHVYAVCATRARAERVLEVLKSARWAKWQSRIGAEIEEFDEGVVDWAGDGQPDGTMVQAVMPGGQTVPLLAMGWEEKLLEPLEDLAVADRHRGALQSIQNAVAGRYTDEWGREDPKKMIEYLGQLAADALKK